MTVSSQLMIIPVVEADVTTGPTINSMLGPSLEPVFRCQFVELPDIFSYDVVWFINDDLVVDFKNITYANIQTTLLKPSHWTSIYRLNILVRCSVRARNEYFIQTGPFHKSEIYTAGLIPQKFEYNVQEGKTVTVRYNVTVPIGCFGTVISSTCHHNFFLSLPEYQDRNQCNASTSYLNFNQYYCGFAINFDSWKQPVELVVHGRTSGLYDHTDRTMFIHIESAKSMTSGIWDYASIPEVKIVVSDGEYNMTGRQCHSYNDPHIRTADGTQFDTTEQGEFVLYRSKRGPYAVHVFFGSCGTDTALASCNCGIAIKNNQSLFLVRTACDTGSTAKINIGSSSPYIERRNCDQSSMIIEEYGNFYQVTLPTGTEIEFYISDGFIPVINIKPSVLDVENTDGLCGFISSDGNTYDDLIQRDSRLITTDVQVFVNSWRASSEEELFVIEPNLPIIYPFLKQYCSCTAEASAVDNLDDFNSLQCFLSESMVPCLEIQHSHFKSFENTCEPSNTIRKKRSSGNQYVKFPVSDPDDVMDIYWTSNITDAFDLQIVPQSMWKNGWNWKKARTECEQQLKIRISPDIFTFVPMLTIKDYIESCITDIKSAGDTRFMKDTVTAIQLFSKKEAYRYNSMNDLSMLFQRVHTVLCVDNCNGKGKCISGKCLCNDGYIGISCSSHISIPPHVLSLPEDGLCDSVHRPCKKTNIHGEFYSKEVICKSEYFIINSGRKEYKASNSTSKALYRNFFMVSCDLVVPTNEVLSENATHGKGFDISLSYDGIHFGRTLILVIFDSECMSCSSRPIYCQKKRKCGK
ncbi:Hypothetical predicted protein [Mytilus galloprovincialis]|nr:Hypothetical predicted protein [Mytilus galloprovincialis]